MAWTYINLRAAAGKLERLASGAAYMISMAQVLDAAMGAISQLDCYCVYAG